MQRIGLSVRLLFGLGMVFGMLFFGSATPASARHGAQITIHNAVCAGDVADIFGECHDDRLGGVAFSVAGVRRGTDANGVVSWTPGAGTRTIIQDGRVFDTYEGAYVFCSNQVTGAVLFDGPIDVNRVTITTTAGQGVVCDWYNILPDETSDATLTVYKAACPPGYEGEEYYTDCYDNPEAGVEFALVNTKSDYFVNGTTDGNGLVTFQLPGDLAGDLINIRDVLSWNEVGSWPPDFVVFCTRNGGQPVDFHIDTIFRDPGGGEAYEVEINNIAPGDQIHCDWFNLS